MDRKHDPSIARSSKDSISHLNEPLFTSSTPSVKSTTLVSSEERLEHTRHSTFDRFRLKRPAWLCLSSEIPTQNSNMADWKHEDSILPYLNNQPQLERSTGTHLHTFSPFHPPTIPLPPIPLSPSTPTEPFDFRSIASNRSQRIENLDYLKRSLPGPLPSAPLPPIPISSVNSPVRPESYTSPKPTTPLYDETNHSFPSDDADRSTTLPSRRPLSTASLVSSAYRLSTLSFQSSTTTLPSSDDLVLSPTSTRSLSKGRTSEGSIFTSLARSLMDTEVVSNETSEAISPNESGSGSCDEQESQGVNESGSESDIDLNTSLSTFAMRSRIISPNSRLLIKKLRSSRSIEPASNFLRRPSLPFLHPKPSIQKHRVSLLATSAEMLSYEDGWMASDSEEEVMSSFDLTSETRDSNKRFSLTTNESESTAEKRLSTSDLVLSCPLSPTEPSISPPTPKMSNSAFVRPNRLSDSILVSPTDQTHGIYLASRSLSADFSELALPSDDPKTITGQLSSHEPTPDGSALTDPTFRSPRRHSAVSRFNLSSPIEGRSTPFFGGQVLPLPRRMSDEDETVWGEVEVAFNKTQQPIAASTRVRSLLLEEKPRHKINQLSGFEDEGYNNTATPPAKPASPTQKPNIIGLGIELPQQSRLVKMRSNASLDPIGRKIPTPSIRKVPSNILQTPVQPTDSSSSILAKKQNKASGVTTKVGTSISSIPKVSPHSNTVLGRSPGSLTPPSKVTLSPEVVTPSPSSRIPTVGRVASSSRLPRRTNPVSNSPPSSFKWVSS